MASPEAHPDPAGAEQKSALRRRLADARRALSDDERAAASKAVCERLATLPELATARRVLGYCATRVEVDITPVLSDLLARGVELVLPWVVPDDARGRLGLSVVTDLVNDVEPGWRGVGEPRQAARAPVRADSLDAAIVPGLGFDLHGNRLGHGGGHFDRLLSRLRRGVPVVGVAFDQQLADHILTQPHDRPVDVVVTPGRTVRRERRP